MRLTDVIETSRAVGSTPGRKAKIAAVAELIRAAGPDEIHPVVGWLSG